MLERLYGEYSYTYQDLERTQGMDYVQNYLRMKQVIVFKLSHDVVQVSRLDVDVCLLTHCLQFNFHDHSKLILSSQGLVVTHIDKHYKLTTTTLSDIMLRSLSAPPVDPEVARYESKLLEKLKYAKEVLHTIKVAQETKASAATEEIPIR